jgi:hypothetical protein
MLKLTGLNNDRFINFEVEIRNFLFFVQCRTVSITCAADQTADFFRFNRM